MYVTTTGAGTKSGLSWANAFSLTEFEIDAEVSAEAGDRYFFKEGTYTLASAIITALDGSATSYIEIIGVVSATTAEPPTSSDWATGNNRPIISHNSHSFQINGDYWRLRGLQVETNGAMTSLYLGGYNICAINCKVTNTNAGAFYALYAIDRAIIIDCEAQSTNGYGIRVGTYSFIFGCYAHDSSVKGIIASGNYVYILHCIIDTCGIGLDPYSFLRIVNTTIYNCTSGVTGTNYAASQYYNNVIDNCTTGFKVNAAGVIAMSTLFDYNNWSNNTKDMSWDNGVSEDNLAKGANDTAVAPAFIDAPASNFSLQSNSNLIDAGFSINLGVS